MSRIALATPVALAASPIAPARAETVVKGPDGPSIDCDDVCLYPNGTIESGKDATLMYADKKGSSAEASFGLKVYSPGGTELGEWGRQELRQRVGLVPGHNRI